MRQRRQKNDTYPNRERWLISYADFITLLFGFFVVMYSVSSVNQGKYKVLSETLTGVFNAPQHSIEPIPVGETPPEAGSTPSDAVIEPPVQSAPETTTPPPAARTGSLKTIAGQLESEFESLMRQGVVTLELDENWIELSLNNSLLFASGTAEPHYDAFPVVESIASIIADSSHAVRVEGFTDNRPITTSAYPSNWELSAARAAAVVRILSSEGVDPRRLAAIGYGAHQPVARNDTEEGRQRNRRVVVLISRDASVRGSVR